MIFLNVVPLIIDWRFSVLKSYTTFQISMCGDDIRRKQHNLYKNIKYIENWKMLSSMQKKSTVYSLLLITVWLILVPVNSSYESLWWDDDWSNRQEIDVPIDTNSVIAKYQPIDTRIEFDENCWAKNEDEHSIRICCLNGNNWNELESQVYNLEHIDENHVKSCNIVFLIPGSATGDERYYVYYDDSEKPNIDYVDHVDVEESFYRYEPISGYPLESHYYKIIDEGYIIYAVAQEGQVIGYNTSQHVTKMNDKVTEVKPKNGDLFAAFDFKYYYDEELFGYSSTSQHLVSKEILVNGNLMVEVGIVSTSNRGDLQTTATYKYYHCPTSNTRIHTHVKHEMLKEIKVHSGVNTDGTYASLQCGGVQSVSIEDLNFGQILPYMHVFNERGSITKYSLDTDPEYMPEDPDIRVLSIEDDVDLGKKAWISFDEGDTGISHSLILSSNSIVKSGNDERDGIQINAFEMDYPHLPGLENNLATIQLGRNSYESGGIHDLVIPGDFIVEFDAEFFSSNAGGFNIVQHEADIFQELAKIKPPSNDEFIDDSNETDKHALSVFIHLSTSMPIGSGLSALLGLNFSYINVELYKNEEFTYSGTAVRLPMKPISELGEVNPVKQISAALFSFDWKNLSFFKKICFSNLESGKYTIKIYRENPFFGKQRKYIGFTALELNDDTKTHVHCGIEGALYIHASDQNNEDVKNVEVILLKNGNIMAKNQTGEKGNTLIKAPCSISEKYTVKILYNGFMVHNDTIRLGYLTNIIPKKESVSIERYNLKINVFDIWGMPLEVDVNPVLTSKEMYESTLISGEKLSLNYYAFSNLTPSLYKLNLKYKSYSLEKDINLDSDIELDLDFPAEFQIKVRILDSRGLPIEDTKIIISRNSKKLETKTKDSKMMFSLPPGFYHVKIYDEDKLIGAREIDVFGERNFDFITISEPVFPVLIIIITIFLVAISAVFSYFKKDKMYFLLILPISLVIMAVVSPWWILCSSSFQLETSTNMFLLPLELVTVTTVSDVISGELASLPDIFREYVSLIPIFSVVGCSSIAAGMFLRAFNYQRFYILSLVFASISFVGSILIFFIGMSMLAEVGVGGFMGKGILDVSISGKDIVPSVSYSWGPSLGFYLYVISIFILFIVIVGILSRKYFKSR